MPGLSSPGWDTTALHRTPRIITVMDRQLNIVEDGSNQSLYNLCRKWIHNDPDLDSQSIPETASLPLPPRPEADPEPYPPAPAFSEEADNYDAEEALRRLKDHWVNVRHHQQAKHRHQSLRHRHRLSALISHQQQQQQHTSSSSAAAATAASVGSTGAVVLNLAHPPPPVVAAARGSCA
ncbi:hypothetical protein CEUSTIGMA_g11066.t1 [Chlamydomonas eustigma]|uniref:Uncharacterized protein n=1 Tax=Chlamydomonas eustigma TaxID=1157962 RepID=A0A250XL74_9CHLO|nr:hypothetical protein CEUSTIGMA_g11066.t1 [Chlamydomonas eustigma]|eukprot:GAX83642.1 hypothetical protein CEUSTIGMA_g11066.t1 [Chlamydomonas eustigma]